MDLVPTLQLAARLSLNYSIPTIHVTGTNGKGSVVAYIVGMLMASGLKVGSFVSPHLVHPRDSILIDNLPVSQAKYECVRRRIESVALRENSGFEILTLSALTLFQENTVQVAVIEMGLGVAWDATMVLPEDSVVASVITSIAKDHQGVLGETEEMIAKCKCCIARRGRPLIVSRRIRSELIQVISSHVKHLRCPVILSPSVQELADSGGAFKILNVKIENLKMRGEHQHGNFSVAAAAVMNVLGHLGTLLGRGSLHRLRAEEILVKAAQVVRVGGRLECLPWPPLPRNTTRTSYRSALTTSATSCAHQVDRKDSIEAFRQAMSGSTFSTAAASSASSLRSNLAPERAQLTRTNTMPLSISVSNRSFYFDPPGQPMRLGQTKRLVWLDGAHNPEALRALEKWLRRSDLAIIALSGHSKSRLLLFDMIKCLEPCKRVCFTSFGQVQDMPYAQAVDPGYLCDLYSLLYGSSKLCGAFEDLTAAFEEADRIYHQHLEAGNATIEVLVTGSLYLVGEYYRQFLQPIGS